MTLRTPIQFDGPTGCRPAATPCMAAAAARITAQRRVNGGAPPETNFTTTNTPTRKTTGPNTTSSTQRSRCAGDSETASGSSVKYTPKPAVAAITVAVSSQNRVRSAAVCRPSGAVSITTSSTAMPMLTQSACAGVPVSCPVGSGITAVSWRTSPTRKDAAATPTAAQNRRTDRAASAPRAIRYAKTAVPRWNDTNSSQPVSDRIPGPARRLPQATS